MFASVEGWIIRGLESVQQEPTSEIVTFLQTQVRLSHFVQTKPARDDILTVSHWFYQYTVVLCFTHIWHDACFLTILISFT